MAAEKLQVRSYRALCSGLPVLDEYAHTDGTGMRVLASMENLSERRRLAQTARTSSDAAHRLLGPLRCFPALSESLDGKHLELLVTAGRNLATVMAALQQLADAALGIEQELSDATDKFAPTLLAARSVDLPWSTSACAAGLRNVRLCLSYDVFVKLDVAAGVAARLAELSRGSCDTASFISAVRSARGRWPSPVADELFSQPAAAAAETAFEGADGDPETIARARAWGIVNDISERVRGIRIGH